ncbi:MAG TPA: BON domain-containing protein [Steroidobacteraceae bacterium]|nr:BON domain-containing protein [Steroidobacteraceae bacterium]
MRTDSQIKTDVEAELRWSPEFDDRDIAAKVEGGVVSLTGFVSSYYGKHQAEIAVKRVAGVRAVANDIQVRLASGDAISDPEIARNAATAIKFQLPLALDGVKAIVKEGHVTLEGEVAWNFQRDAVENAVRHLKGVTGVRNFIHLAPRVQPAQIKHHIEEAFRRSAEVDASHISVLADGGQVVLSGKVRSWAERDEAQQTAWAAPGVTRVTNNITVGS